METFFDVYGICARGASYYNKVSFINY